MTLAKMKLRNSAIILAASLLSLIAVAFAWFYSLRSGKAESLDFVSVHSFDVEASFTKFGEYSEELEVGDTGNLNFEEISGMGYENSDGVVTLWKPKKNPFTAEPLTVNIPDATAQPDPVTGEVPEIAVWDCDPAVAGEDFYEFELYFKSTDPGTVCLDPESTVTPKTTDQRMSKFGPFSTDYIAGAVRISVSEVDEASGNETLRVVWAPNASTELIPPTPEDRTKTQTGWSINTNSADVEDYQYYSGTEQLGVGEGELAGLFRSSADAVNPTDMPVASLIMDNEVGAYSAHIRIRIWAEGTDREAKCPLAGGIFETMLCFTSMPEETEAGDTTSQQGGQGNG